MAESQANQTIEPLAQNDGGEKHLQYLGFVQHMVIYFIICFSTVYGYAKENTGPLKPGAQTVENIVKNVTGPIFEKFHDVPMEVLVFLDLKVAEALTSLNRQAPVVMKQVSIYVKYAAQNLPEASKQIASKGLETATKVANTLYIKYEPTAKELYIKYEPVAEKYAVSTWRSMHKLPLFPQVAQIAVPTAGFLLEKYNYIIFYTAENGYLVARYLPLVSIDKIAKVFKEDEEGSTVGQTPQVKS